MLLLFTVDREGGESSMGKEDAKEEIRHCFDGAEFQTALV
ncbi:hypothetical protein CEB3_c08550 [Peptococcaceae bacterium CEB3]|nr:hypothetical protein CEB3_c08550 [Peptococcaceae bacterium CEB3]